LVKKFGFVTALFSIIAGMAFNNGGHAQQATAPDADVVVVGAGISGLSAALEAGRDGAKRTAAFAWLTRRFSGPLESRITRNWLTRIS
jgi:threonine dehydrogenase-like Zn-dependent dehydrogenase